MGKYLKRFILASLVYLGLAAIFGILIGTTDIGYFGNFAHTHFNLLGFMSMMIFGIGYFIIPRFNGRDLRFESWVAPHFWLGNISLVGMVIFRGLYIATGSSLTNVLFVVSASVQVITIFMFIINVWLTLSPKKQEVSTPTARPVPVTKPQNRSKFVVTDQTKIGDLVDALPALQQYLINAGLGALSLPGHLDKVRQMGITIGTAAGNHGLDLDRLIVGIEEQLRKEGFDTRVSSSDYPASTVSDAAPITSDILIGNVIEKYPEARSVFERHFGNGCFDCPGQSFESIDMACRIHGIEPDSFIAELNAVVGE